MSRIITPEHLVVVTVGSSPIDGDDGNNGSSDSKDKEN